METVIMILQGVLGLMFLGAGGSKLAGMEMHVENFKKWGYPDWFRLVTGVVEVAGAALLLAGLLLDETAVGAAGAFLIAGTMVGGTLTHIRNDEMPAAPVTIVLGLLALGVLLVRVDVITV